MVSQSSSVGYTIMEKTADLTVVQKTTIDTLHKEGKTQKIIAKEAGCSQSSVSKHINREAKGRKRCGRKKCTSNRDNCTLERIVKQNPFKNVGEIHKEWTAAGVEVCTGSKLKPEPGLYPRSSDPTRPDPSGTVKFKARTRPEIPPPPPHNE